MPRKILVVFGTRPEAIKMAPVVRLLRDDPDFELIVCVTSQHKEMLSQVLRVFDITTDYDLDIMREGQSLFDISVDSLRGLRGVLEKERPDVLLVQGDTTTAFAAGLSAYYFKVPVGHIEAGLRTYNKYSPFPEEMNRHMLSVLADFHFAPTEWAKSNLLKEAVSPEKIWITGNTVVDALLTVREWQKAADTEKRFIKYFKEKWDLTLPSEPDESKLLLVTGHRRESFGEGFENICAAIKEIAEKRDVLIVYPVHLNPNVQGPVKKVLSGTPNVRLIEPLEYEAFVFLMGRAHFIITDSGGIQEEAPSLGKPVLVMRENTERPEGVDAGTVRLVGTDRETIVEETLRLLDNEQVYKEMSSAINPYGDGRAAEKIVAALKGNS